MSTTDNDETQSAQPPNSTTVKLMTLPYIKSVRQSDRAESTHIIDLGIGSVGLDHELHEIEQHGVEIGGISKHGDYGLRLFVRIV